MRRYFGGFGKVAGFVGLALALLVAGSPVVLAVDVNNFVVKDYQVDMVLSRDDEQRSVLETTETITAVFPDFDQNHGIERSLVDRYDGHSTNLKIESITHPDGRPWNYELNDTGILRVGENDRFVRGEQTFIIKYSQRDVTKHFGDEGIDEIHWDSIGSEWRVPIERAEISLHVASNLVDKMTDSISCYRGAVSSVQQCSYTTIDELDGQRVVRVVDYNLSPNTGVTIGVAFKGGTFAGYGHTFWEKVIGYAVIANFASIIPVFLLGVVMTWIHRKKAITPEIRRAIDRAVVPQYLPPVDSSVLDSCKIFYSSMRSRALSGYIIDLAVQHYVVLRQTSEKKVFSKAKYEIEMIRKVPEGSRLWGGPMLVEIFDGVPKVGSVASTDDIQKRSDKMSVVFRSLGARFEEENLFYYASKEASEYAKRASKVLFIVGLLTLTITTLALALIMYYRKDYRFINEKGVELKKYLEGLKMYIGMAEERRLKMLQSPDVVEKVGDIVSDRGARIKLYERLLPYAILFGQEKKWAKYLGDLYSETAQSPNWSNVASGFSASSFTSSLGGFTANISSASSYSSSSSGSGGGGSVGGGGGGGGGGGW